MNTIDAIRNQITYTLHERATNKAAMETIMDTLLVDLRDMIGPTDNISKCPVTGPFNDASYEYGEKHTIGDPVRSNRILGAIRLTIHMDLTNVMVRIPLEYNKKGNGTVIGIKNKSPYTTNDVGLQMLQQEILSYVLKTIQHEIDNTDKVWFNITTNG